MASLFQLDEFKVYTVSKDSKSLKLKPQQLTTQVLSKLFGLFPDSIVLVSKDGYVEVPSNDGTFTDVDDIPTWTVSGDEIVPTSTGSTSVGPFMNPYSYQPLPLKGQRGKRGRKWVPTNNIMLQRQKPPGVRAQQQQLSLGECTSHRSQQSTVVEWRKYVEICKWNEREGQWKKVSNLPLQLTDDTANVQQVSEMVAEDAFSGETAVLVDVDYLRIPDTANTKGK